MALDALFFGAHPDDVELTSGGLAALLASHGHAVGIADLTRGEAASRGTHEERALEAAEAAKILGVGRTRVANLDEFTARQAMPRLSCCRSAAATQCW